MADNILGISGVVRLRIIPLIRHLNLNLPFSNWHFGPGLFDLLIMTLQGQTFFTWYAP